MARNGHSHARGWTGRAAIVFVAFAAIAAFFLFSEHRAHLLGILPWALLLLCPMLHLFMHGGHAGHGHGQGTRRDPGQSETSSPTDLEERGTSRHA